VQVRTRLAAARAAGVAFEDAWPRALTGLLGNRADCRLWRAVLEETRAEWQAAYEGRSTEQSRIVRAMRSSYRFGGPVLAAVAAELAPDLESAA
jgi:hypothetical protein